MTTAKKTKSRDVDEVLREMNVPKLTIGRILKTTRTSEDASQDAFAKKLGIPKAELSHIENGRSVVSVKRAIAFARKLGYSPEVYAKLALEEAAAREGLEIEVSIKAPMAKTAAKTVRKTKVQKRVVKEEVAVSKRPRKKKAEQVTELKKFA